MEIEYYEKISIEEQMGAVLERIRDTEIEHFTALLNLDELVGTDVVIPEDQLTTTRTELHQRIESCNIRLNNLKRLRDRYAEKAEVTAKVSDPNDT